jgi:ATP-binding protein involved in chromosome partitioning
MRKFRTYGDVAAPEAEKDVVGQVVAQIEKLAARLAPVKRIIVVGSGKGGVGKSVIAANLAAALADRGLRVGAVDADLNGPTLARMLGAARERIRVDNGAAVPPEGVAGIRVMSMDLLLESDTAPLRWRNAGERAPDPATGDPGFTPPEFLFQSTFEAGVLREFLSDVAWGELDALVIDAPPGTDKLVRLLQLLPRLDVVLLVTTPGEASRFVVAKSIRLVQDAGANCIGIVANMTSHVCAACGHETPLFQDDRTAALASDAGVEVWAELPFDVRLATSTDNGRPFVLQDTESAVALGFRRMAERIEGTENGRVEGTENGFISRGGAEGAENGFISRGGAEGAENGT